MGKRIKRRWALQEGTVFRWLRPHEIDERKLPNLREFIDAPWEIDVDCDPLLLVVEGDVGCAAVLVNRKQQKIAYSCGKTITEALMFLDGWCFCNILPWEAYQTDQLELLWDDFWALVEERHPC